MILIDQKFQGVSSLAELTRAQHFYLSTTVHKIKKREDVCWHGIIAYSMIVKHYFWFLVGDCSVNVRTWW